jgi:hypothetical protein
MATARRLVVTGIEQEEIKLARAFAVAHGEKGVGEAAIIVSNASKLIGPDQTGSLSASYRPSVTKTRSAVYTPLIYAPVIEYGWPAHNIEPQKRIGTAFFDHLPEVEAAMLGAIERAHVEEGGGK